MNNLLGDLYQKKLDENAKNLKIWEDYSQSLNSLDLYVHSNKLNVNILVPIGNKALFRGSLKHTNEVTISLGADYFVKCSVKQAEIIRQRRIKDAQSKVEIYKKERAYLENQATFNKEYVHNKSSQGIVETCSEKEDNLWRRKHRKRVRQYNQSKEKKEEKMKMEVNDKELWERLEVLELQEELENEMSQPDCEVNLNKHPFTKKDKDLKKNPQLIAEAFNILKETTNSIHKKHGATNVSKPSVQKQEQASKFDVLKLIIDRQKYLQNQLLEIQNKERSKSITEKDLIDNLDEMEKVDEVEDEMDRISNILDSEDTEDTEDAESIQNVITKNKRGVSFANDEDVETLEITFKHSEIMPISQPYMPDNGINKPSDIYQAFSYLFIKETTSILRKTVNTGKTNEVIIDEDTINAEERRQDDFHQTIIIKDVVEKKENNQIKPNKNQRNTSLFKKQRQKQKSKLLT